jgi:NAD(P)H-quinone oxidoreductase subunit I
MIKVEGKEKVFPQIDYNTCCFCGYCVIYCPKQALEFTDLVEFAVHDRQELVYSPMRLSETPNLQDVLPQMKRRTEAYLTDKEMKYREVKDV